MPDIEVVRDVLDLVGDLVRRADDDIAAVEDLVHVTREQLEFRGITRHLGDLRYLALDAAALRRLAGIAGRVGKAPIDMQAAAIEILGRLLVQFEPLLAAPRNPDDLQKPGAIRVAVLAEPRHLVPE